MPLALAPIDNPHAKELAAIGDILDGEPEILDLVLADLLGEKRKNRTGRNGMTAEQVLRA